MTEFYLVRSQDPSISKKPAWTGISFLATSSLRQKVLADFLRRDCPMEKEPRNEKTVDGLL